MVDHSPASTANTRAAMPRAHSILILASSLPALLSACHAPRDADGDSANTDADPTAPSSGVDVTTADDGADGGSDGGGSDGNAPDVHDGDRLVLRVADDGARVLGIYDTELEVACAFREASDGRLRCLPLVFTQQRYDAASGLWLPYADGSVDCPPSYLLAVDPPDPLECDTPAGTAVYTVGEELTEVCTATTGELCTVTRNVPDDADARFFAAGELVPPGSFVAGEIEQGDGGRLRPRYVAGDDGSRFAWDLYDTEVATPCAFAIADDGIARCLPTSRGPDGFAFVDGAPDPVPYRRGNLACLPAHVGWPAAVDAFACDPQTTALHLTGATLDEVCVQRTGDMCSAWQSFAEDAPAGATFVLAGDARPSSTFVAATSMTRSDPGRLRTVQWVTDDGLEIPAGLFDDELGIACAWGLAADDTWRCLPTTPTTDGDLDPATTDLTLARRGNTGCPPPYLTWTETGSSFACTPAVTHVHDVAGTTDTLCTSVSAGMCVATQGIADTAPAGATYFLAGAEHDPSAFAAGG
jgi:hypothetical protein